MEITIEKMVYGGEGMGRQPADESGKGKAVFVPFVLPGEKVAVEIEHSRPGFSRARLETVMETSGKRIEAGCEYFGPGKCGGCHYQQADPETQIAWKVEILREALRRGARLEWSSEIAVLRSEPWHYRNRTRMQVRHAGAEAGGFGAGGPFALGYYRQGTHELMEIERCPISSLLINRALAALWEMGRRGEVPSDVLELEFFSDAEDGGLLLQAYVSGERMEPKVADDFAQALSARVAEVRGVAYMKARRSRLPSALPLVEDEESAAGAVAGVAGEEALLYRAAGHEYRVSAGSFFQTNRTVVDALARAVTEGREGELAMDLYAGVGLFTAGLSGKFARVEAVEAGESSFNDLKRNVATNVKATRATTLDHLKRRKGALPELVVVDPPRAGLGGAVVRELGKLTARELVYVSCDPATLARDIAGLMQAGYQLRKVTMADMFPQTYHIESVVEMGRTG